MQQLRKEDEHGESILPRGNLYRASHHVLSGKDHDLAFLILETGSVFVLFFHN